MENDIRFIGNIKLGCQVVCSDPCYDDYGDDSSVNCTFNNVKAGNYYAFYGTADFKNWGNRITQIIVTHEDYNSDIITDFSDFEWIGDCCVDSGTCGIWDYDYFETYHEDGLNDDWYDNNICNLLDKIALFGGVSICSSSGFGDGCYGVYGKYNDKNQLVAIQIVYISDEEDDDVNDWGYNEEED